MNYRLLFVATLALLSFSAAHAQTENTSTWPDHNRYVALNVGQQQQNYRELDTQGLTTDGTLNRESGAQTHAQTALRWQWASGITAQLSHARQNGATAYQGYLQNGAGNLTPYAARTGNVAHQTSVQLGYAINSGNNATIPSNWQLTPLLAYTQHHWQRNLAQYSETYRHTSTAAGLRLQWQATPSTVIEAQALLGRTQPARATVPAWDR